MTKKHYEMVAAALRAEIEANPGPGGIAESARTASRRIAATLADAFAIDNARFDPVLFLAAVEPGEPVTRAIETHRCKNGHTLVFDAGNNMVHSNDGHRCNDVEFVSPIFEVVASGYVDVSEPGQIVITEGLPRMGENRLGVDSVMEWDDLSDFDAHLDDVGE